MTKTCFGNIIIFVTSFNKFVINEKEKVMIGDYMTNRILKTAGLFCFCTLMAAAAPERAMADQEAPRPLLHAVDGPEEPEIIIAGRKDTEDQAGASMLIQVEDENTEVYSEPDTESQVVGQAEAGDTYDVLEMVDGQWAKISTGEFEGYLNTAAAEDEEETLEDAPEEAPVVPVETAEETAARVSAERRQAVVEYGLQFVGNRYVYGGTNPNKGADCSGFTSYVLRHSAGVDYAKQFLGNPYVYGGTSLTEGADCSGFTMKVFEHFGISTGRSSRDQAAKGKEIPIDSVQPGDLLFYASGDYINHVALYIGNGQVVHASNERTGICVSEWTYRNPAKIVNVLGD